MTNTRNLNKGYRTQPAFCHSFFVARYLDVFVPKFLLPIITKEKGELVSLAFIPQCRLYLGKERSYMDVKDRRRVLGQLLKYQHLKGRPTR
jgi:hypothetical protein